MHGSADAKRAVKPVILVGSLFHAMLITCFIPLLFLDHAWTLVLNKSLGFRSALVELNLCVDIFHDQPLSSAVSALGVAAWARTVCVFSLCYYVYDTALVTVDYLYNRGNTGVYVLGIAIHHALCVSGLMIPLFLHKDLMLICGGFFLGELSNPPRVLMLILQYAYPSYRSDLRAQLSLLHSALFVVLRVACVQFISKAVYPCSQSPWTMVVSVLHVAFSIVVVFFAYSKSGEGSGHRACPDHDGKSAGQSSLSSSDTTETMKRD